MLTLIVAFALNQMCVMQNGTLKACSVKTVNCGANVSCSITNDKWQLSATSSGSSGDGGLVPGVVDGGSCSANQYAHAVDIHGAPTCSQVSYSQLSGSPIAGGSPPQVQYNNSGNLGGVSNANSDGTHLTFTPESSHPSTPATDTVTYQYRPLSTWPAQDWRIDAFFGVAMPQGWLREATLVPNDTSPSSYKRCRFAESNASVLTVQYGTALALTLTGGTSSQNWDAGSFTIRQPWSAISQTGNSNQASARETTTSTPAPTRQQGFLLWARIWPFTVTSGSAIYVGWQASGSAPVTANPPSSLTDIIYMGADFVDTNFSICHNDSSGTASCSSLGNSFPAKPSNGISGEVPIDIWFAAIPGDSTVYWYVRRLDDGSTTNGNFSSDLPQSNAPLFFIYAGQNGWDAGTGTTQKWYISGTCDWTNL
jgi:hypothetical protein